jgi:glycosyltransferase involved in cell wall biosynthesis
LKKLLIIGYTFPEPSTTAAGTRMMQLIDLFRSWEYQISFATTASTSERSADLSDLGVSIESIRLNDASFDVYLSSQEPDIVLFDRFITEEQFGWRVTEQCPNALRILDTEDLHFLRKAREEAVRQQRNFTSEMLYTDTAKREIASILRCDLSLLISEAEIQLLIDQFKVPEQLLYYLPFMINPLSTKERLELPNFDARINFITIGNLKHAPNVDAIRYLKLQVWPEIRQQLPTANLYCYGAYAPQQIREFHNESDGFIIAGWAPSVSEVMSKARVCIAPLRFGAGLKGKLIDAMQYGTPSVTTPIGAEGLTGEMPFAGKIVASPNDIVAASVALYSSEKEWTTAQQNGYSILQKRFAKENFSEAIKKRITSLAENIQAQRNINFIGQILQHHSLQSTKYLSKWIEAKSKKPD